MGLFDFINRNGNIPMPGTSAYKAFLNTTGHTDSYGRSLFSAQQAIPPVGTSAYNSYLASVGTDGNGNEPPSVASTAGSNSANSVSHSSLKPQTVDYLNAELASYYGMSRSTAYQEALSNTAYQRAVKDMKAAGLNPAVLFGSGHGSGANSAIYASEDSSRSYGFGRSASSAKDKLFDSSTYAALSAIGGLVGIAATGGNPNGYWVGSMVTQGAMGLMDAVYVASNK